MPYRLRFRYVMCTSFSAGAFSKNHVNATVLIVRRIVARLYRTFIGCTVSNDRGQLGNYRTNERAQRKFDNYGTLVYMHKRDNGGKVFNASS